MEFVIVSNENISRGSKKLLLQLSNINQIWNVSADISDNSNAKFDKNQVNDSFCNMRTAQLTGWANWRIFFAKF
jgi:hypothetical protein